MLILTILSLIENAIVSFFITQMSHINNKRKFIIINTFLCTLMTFIFNLYDKITYYLPFVMIITILIVLNFFVTKFTFHDIVISLLAPTLIILTDLIALLFYSFFINFNLKTLTTNSIHITIASFIAKLFLFYISQLIVRVKTSNNYLSYSKWYVLFPICFLIFSSIYTLGNMIVTNSFSTLPMYYLIVCLVLLSILIIILYHNIQKESLEKNQVELNAQKEIYIRQSRSIMLRLHNEISTIDHNNMYILLQIKQLLKNKKYEDINGILDSKILQLRKYKNIIYTGNPYFDYSINKQINVFNLSNKDIKAICLVHNNDYYINKNELDLIIDYLKYLISISDDKKPFTIEISNNSTFLIISFIFYKEKEIDQCIITDLYAASHSNSIKYSYANYNSIITFKIVMELK